MLQIISAYSSSDIAYPVEGGNIYFNKLTGTITDCDAYVTSAVIPNKISGVAVTTIGHHAFSQCGSLTKVVFGDSVTTIGNSAFYSCSSLTIICRICDKRYYQ